MFLDILRRIEVLISTTRLSTDLGFSFRRTQVVVDRSHIARKRSRGIFETPLFIQLWGGQGQHTHQDLLSANSRVLMILIRIVDGQVLGLGG
jgi:hypothetical protein